MQFQEAEFLAVAKLVEKNPIFHETQNSLPWSAIFYLNELHHWAYLSIDAHIALHFSDFPVHATRL
jgi:hypothetical protein